MISGSWTAWRDLTGRERRQAGVALWNALVVGILLRVRGYKPTRKFVDRPQPVRRGQRVKLCEIVRATRGVVRRLPWSPNCLERSLVLARVARRLGEDPILKFGVRRDQGSLTFHAWVEVDGVVLGDRQKIASRFRPFGGDVLPPRAKFD